MNNRPLTLLLRQANAEVVSLLSDGYRWIAELQNHRSESYYAFLRHPRNGHRASVRISQGEGSVMIDGLITKTF